MSEEEKETIDKIETLCKYLDVWKENYTIVPKDKRYFKTLLNLIQKQEKIIKHLAAECSICSGRYEYMEIKEIIKHFEKKVVDEDVKD